MTEDTLEIGDRQIWLRAFYGFDPEGAGYIGFTHPGDQQEMLSQMRDGDLVLIYGAVEELTQQDLRAQALGFLEIELEPCTDRDRMSQASYDWKLEHDFENRWTHGIKVRRAWRVRNRVGIASIAPEAYQSKNRFVRTTRAILLTPEERERALSHPVRQTNVFGEPPITAESFKGPMSQAFKPSQGIPPSFGKRSAEYEDGENQLYLMILMADAQVLLGVEACRPAQALVKVGRSNDPARRLEEVNCGFPKSAVVRWQLVSKQAFADGATAHAHEDELKSIFDREFRSEGGEFFTGDRQKILKCFQDFTVAKLHKIIGATAKAQGI